jgi:hypothetical protein
MRKSYLTTASSVGQRRNLYGLPGTTPSLSLPFDLSQSRTVRARLQSTASRSSQRRKVADQKRAQRKEVARRRLSGGNAAASQTLSSTPRPNETHQVRAGLFVSLLVITRLNILVCRVCVLCIVCGSRVPSAYWT